MAGEEAGGGVNGTRPRRYVRIPEECISLCAENLGIQTSREVTGALVEDVSFRIRQVTQLALEFMKHSNRKRACKEDFDNALKWSGIEPVYGHTVEPSPFIYIHENGLYSVEDQEVLLQELSLSAPVSASDIPPPPSLSAQWLTVEGVPIEPPQGTLDDVQNSVQLQRSQVEAHQNYLSVLMEGITGDSEELRRIALTDIQANPTVANILPDLAQYLLEMLSVWVQFTPTQLMRILKMIHSLFRNKQLFLNPYGMGLFPLVKSILLTQNYLHCDTTSDHWSVRRMAALCLAEITARCATPVNEYIPDINSSFQQLLSQSDVPLPVLYGLVHSLCQLGGKTLSVVLFPRLDTICVRVQNLFKSSDLGVRDSALRVYESLLLSAEVMLMSGVSVEVRPEHISTSSSTSSPSHLHTFSIHQSLNGGGGGGAHDNSFLSSFAPPPSSSGGKSLMDTSDLNLGPPLNMPTLYEFLEDIFGEGLLLRLTGRLKNIALSRERKSSLVGAGKTEKQDRPGKGVGVGGGGMGGRRESVEARMRTKSDEKLLFILRSEGFRTCKVRLPVKVLSVKPPAYHPWGRQLWRFQIPTTILPFPSNVLEHRPSRRRGVPVAVTTRKHNMRRSRTLRTRPFIDLGIF